MIGVKTMIQHPLAIAHRQAKKILEERKIKFGRFNIGQFEFIIQNAKIHNVIRRYHVEVDGQEIEVQERMEAN